MLVWSTRFSLSSVKPAIFFIKDRKEYKIRNRTDQMVQALKGGLHYPPVNIEAEVNAIWERKATMKEAMEPEERR